MYRVYVIWSKEGFQYIGHSPDLERRLTEHNTGMSHSTKHGSGWRIVFKREFPTRSEAMKFERYLKSSAGRRYLKKLLGTNRGVESVPKKSGRSSSSGS